MGMSLPLSPAQCSNCARARKYAQKIMCTAHWARFTEWMNRFGKREAWEAALSEQTRMTVILAWQRWERDNSTRMCCPRCGSEALASGCCTVCGYGARERPMRRRRTRMHGKAKP